MKPPSLCLTIRERWLEHALEAPQADVQEHLAACAACGAWQVRVERQVGALRALSALPAPEVLERGVRECLERQLAAATAAPASRWVAILRALPARSAPRALDERVERTLGAGARARYSIGELGEAQAPQVLERLVGEELEAPEAHRAERFIGQLGGLSAPEDLGRRVQRSLGARRMRGLWTSMGSLAAAGLLVLVALQWSGEDPGDVLGPSDIQGRGPSAARTLGGRLEIRMAVGRPTGMALGLAAALNGGVLPEGHDRPSNTPEEVR